jgi:hypothetical protein
LHLGVIMDKRIKQSYVCARSAIKEIKQLPCRVDEMTTRELAIFKTAADLCGSLKWIQDTLYDVLKESK